MTLKGEKLSAIFGIIKFIQVIVQGAMILYIDQTVLPPNPDIFDRYRICAYLFLSMNTCLVIGYSFFEKSPLKTFQFEAKIFLAMTIICFFVGLSELLHVGKYKILDEETVSLLYWCVLCYNPLLLFAVEFLSIIIYCIAPKNVNSSVGSPEIDENEDFDLSDNEVVPPTTPLLAPEDPPTTIPNSEIRVNYPKVSVEGKPKIPVKSIKTEDNPKVHVEDKLTKPVKSAERIEVMNNPIINSS